MLGRVHEAKCDRSIRGIPWAHTIRNKIRKRGLHLYAHLDSTDVGHNATLNLAGTNLMISSGFHAEGPMVSVLLCRILHLRCHRLPSLFLAIELYLSPRVAILFGLAFDI